MVSYIKNKNLKKKSDIWKHVCLQTRCFRSVDVFVSFEHLASLFFRYYKNNICCQKAFNMPRDKTKKRGTGGMFRKGTKNGLLQQHHEFSGQRDWIQMLRSELLSVQNFGWLLIPHMKRRSAFFRPSSPEPQVLGKGHRRICLSPQQYNHVLFLLRW